MQNAIVLNFLAHMKAHSLLSSQTKSWALGVTPSGKIWAYLCLKASDDPPLKRIYYSETADKLTVLPLNWIYYSR